MGNLDDIVQGLYSFEAWAAALLSMGVPGAMPHVLVWKGGVKALMAQWRGTNLVPLYARDRAEECQLSMPKLTHKPVLKSAFFLLPSCFFPQGRIHGMKKGDNSRKAGISRSDKLCRISRKEHHGFWGQKAGVQITLPLTSCVTLATRLTSLCHSLYLLCKITQRDTF